MAKKKKISRKELLKEPDEFLTFSARAIQFGLEHKRLISYGAIGLVAIIAVLGLIRYFLNLSERRAYAVFEEGLTRYVAQVSGEESPESKKIAEEKFAEVLKNHASTNAAGLSLPLYADMYYQEGSYDKAIELYEKAIDAFPDDNSLRKMIWNGLGYAYEGKKDYKNAAQYFQKITSSEGGLLKADAYYNLGRMYEAMNEREKAREAYDHVVQEYPDSIHRQIAEEKALRLKEEA